MLKITKQFQRFFLLPSICIFSTATFAQTVDEIFDGLIETELSSYESVENFLVQTEMMGVSTVEYFEKTSSFQQGGKTYNVMRSVPITELQQRQSPDNPIANATSADLRNVADVIESQGAVAQQEFESQLAASGVGGIGGGALGAMILNPPPDQPWLSPNPRDMTNMYAMMLRSTATAQDIEAARDPEAEARLQAQQMNAVRANTRIVGRETIDGRPAIGLVTDGIEQTQAANGQEFTLNSMTMWVDAERFLPLRLKMDGEAIIDGQRQEMSIERNDINYQQIPGCGPMYKPSRSIMRIGGMMSPEQMAQMQEAQAQLAEFEIQMAQMPEAQRAMIMRQMGPQMEMMRNMVNSGGLEIMSTTVQIRCNTGAGEALDIAMASLTNNVIPGAALLQSFAPPPRQAAVVETAVPNDAALKAAQQSCIQQKIADAEQSRTRRRGLGGLLNTVTRAAAQLGNFDLAGVTSDIYSATSTADDLAQAARDLGLTTDQLAECQNPNL